MRAAIKKVSNMRVQRYKRATRIRKKKEKGDSKKSKSNLYKKVKNWVKIEINIYYICENYK